MARPKKLNVETELALVAKDLIEHNQDVAHIGLIVGALGTDSLEWLSDLKKECTSVDEFIEIAAKRAEIQLISAAIKNAMGYDYEEVDCDIAKIPVGYGKNRKPKMRLVERGRKVKTKHARANETLLKFLLKNYIPQYFQDVSKVEINKKSIEIKEITADEIKRFAGKLLETVDSEEAGA
ncbi:MAG: hypothetical protein P8016_09455 [Sedimentisphaerales bacterium]